MMRLSLPGHFIRQYSVMRSANYVPCHRPPLNLWLGWRYPVGPGGNPVSGNLAVLGSGDIDFRILEVRFSGPAGARDAFERLVADIVGIVHPDVQEIQANPGDWGIDAFIGNLEQNGSVHVWQSKYFINGFGESQQKEVRDSYKSAKSSAAKHGYNISSWTLCIPCELDAPMTTWWTGWKKRAEKADEITINLEPAGKLRRRLQAPAGRPVRDHYFSPVFSAPQGNGDVLPPRGLRELIDDTEYDDALFVHQMNEAGLPETFSAREAFFNAEILEREVTDKGIATELSTLSTWRVRISSTWSSEFNNACQASTERHLPGLYSNVQNGIENSHGQEAASLRAHVIHGIGLLHQAVDKGRAGWVRDWRKVAQERSAYRQTVHEANGQEEGNEQV